MTAQDDDLVEALAAIRAGDLRVAPQVDGRLAALGGAVASAARLAFDAALSLVDRAHGEPPTVDALASFTSAQGEARRWACAALGDLERTALITFDRAALDRARTVHRSLVDDPNDLGLRRADAWHLLMNGEAEALEDAGRELFAAASAGQHASAVIDATSLRALGALACDRLDEATTFARRASRMARTEGLRPERYLASILLARVRRRAGRPHLSTRILSSIGAIAPSPWRGWLAWEQILAGSSVDLDAAGTLPSERAARALVELIDAAARGARGDFERGVEALAEVAAGFSPMAREGRVLAACLDPRIRPASCPEVARPWCVGEEAETPLGFGGLVGPPDGPADSTIACVVTRRGDPARRILRIALPLLEAEGKVLRLSRTRLRRGRVDTAVAALALAGDVGLRDEELFLRAYEFSFQPSIHTGILDVLVHRMRARLEGAATVHRDAGRMRLEPHGVLALSDPRCVEHVEDRLVRLIATLGSVTTRRAARELDVSVRTAQLALRRLLESGDCVQSRDGRRVHYSVEDTTFTEPTRF